MRKPVVLITGAGGEIGHGLIERLVESGRDSIVTLDVNALELSLAKLVRREFTGSGRTSIVDSETCSFGRRTPGET